MESCTSNFAPGLPVPTPTLPLLSITNGVVSLAWSLTWKLLPVPVLVIESLFVPETAISVEASSVRESLSSVKSRESAVMSDASIELARLSLEYAIPAEALISALVMVPSVISLVSIEVPSVAVTVGLQPSPAVPEMEMPVPAVRLLT